MYIREGGIKIVFWYKSIIVELGFSPGGETVNLLYIRKSRYRLFLSIMVKLGFNTGSNSILGLMLLLLVIYLWSKYRLYIKNICHFK